MNNPIADIVAGILIGIFCFYIGCAFGIEKCRREAVAAKVAEYYLDKDNNKQFRFVNP